LHSLQSFNRKASEALKFSNRKEFLKKKQAAFLSLYLKIFHSTENFSLKNSDYVSGFTIFIYIQFFLNPIKPQS